MAEDKLVYETRTGKVTIDRSRCEPACTVAIVQADRLYGRNVLKIEGNKAVLAVTDPAEIKRLDNESLAIEYYSRLHGSDSVTIELPIKGLDEYKKKVGKGG